MIKAVLFDMDGVICDSNLLINTFELEILKRYGVDITLEKLGTYAGVPYKDILEEYIGDQGLDLEKLDNEKNDLAIEKGKGKIKPIQGIYELLKRVHGNYKIAVVSGSRRRFVEFILDELDVRKYFEAIISADDVKKGKPNPESYLLAAKKLGVEASECIVIEDGVSGMESAKKAGMKCIGLVKDLDVDVPADKKVLSLNDVEVDDY